MSPASKTRIPPKATGIRKPIRKGEFPWPSVDTGLSSARGNPKPLSLDQMDPRDDDSNTKSSRAPMAKFWCFTWFKATAKDMDHLDQALRELHAEFLHGDEICPTTGRQHRQGFIAFQKKMRPNETKSLTSICEMGVHFERTRSNRKNNVEYVTKDHTDIRGNIPYDEPLKLITTLYPWQQEIVDLVKSPPDDRSIYWYWEPEGNVGKSALCKLLCAKHDALLCSGRAADVKYMVAQQKEKTGAYPKCVIYDVPRTTESNIVWSAMEEVKNGCFASTKYESTMVIMNSPHLICFANFEPPCEVMSNDRWKINELNNVMEPVYSE